MGVKNGGLPFVFIRKLKSPSGKIYIQVIEKSEGKYKVLKSFGSFHSDEEQKRVLQKAQNWIINQTGIQELDFSNTDW